MTKAQERAIARIRSAAEKDLFFGHKADYEFKEWKVTEYETFVSVALETGRKGDEGTLAAVVCRDRAHLFVGTRGGITYYKSKRDKHGNYAGETEKRWGGSILRVVIDQR